MKKGVMGLNNRILILPVPARSLVGSLAPAQPQTRWSAESRSVTGATEGTRATGGHETFHHC